MSYLINLNTPIKLIMLGEYGVGKSSIFTRYCNNSYFDFHLTTIGVDFKSKIVEIHGKPIKVHIWDTAGQEKFRTIVSHYYRGSDGVLLIFDLTNIISFYRLRNWIHELKEIMENQDYKLILIGNKSDLISNRQVNQDDIDKLVNLYSMTYYETSAKKDINIESTFIKIIEDIIESKKKKSIANNHNRNSYYEINLNDNDSKIKINNNNITEKNDSTKNKPYGCCS